MLCFVWCGSFVLVIFFVATLHHALDCSMFELELVDSQYRVNAWSKEAVEAVAALDADPNDDKSFGRLQVRFFSCCILFFMHLIILLYSCAVEA